MRLKTIRKFEIPYNFDKQLIDGLQILKIDYNMIDCIYMCPQIKDYITVNRSHNDIWAEISEEEYKEHLAYIDSIYPNKRQLLLQQRDRVLSEKELEPYIKLGFNNFCCGSLEQAKILKNIDKNIKTVGSIVIKIRIENLLDNPEYQKYFDAMVLDFSFNKDIQKLKEMPMDMKYILLCNSLCNKDCDGLHHWFSNPGEKLKCAGLIQEVGFNQSCLLRPMDLKYFDPYIDVYKIQDRGWPTDWILRDIVLYTTDYDSYPGIIYDEDLYEK